MANCSVLVVDDDAVLAATIAEVLGSEGFSTRTAENGLEALHELERDQPEVVLLDMRMPVLDGWGVARVLGSRRDAVKLIVMTEREDVARCADQVHADGYLPKPFGIVELVSEIRRLSAA